MSADKNLEAERAAPCPWCGDTPDVSNDESFRLTDGVKYGALHCCVTGPEVRTDYKDVSHWKAAAIEAWNDRRTPAAAAIGEDGMPALPSENFCAWLKEGQVVNAFTHPVGNRAAWDRDGYWLRKGFDRAPLYTAEQVRQAQRDAVAADSQARISADQWAGLETARLQLEAAKEARLMRQAALQELADQAQEMDMGYGATAAKNAVVEFDVQKVHIKDDGTAAKEQV